MSISITSGVSGASVPILDSAGHAGQPAAVDAGARQSASSTSVGSGSGEELSPDMLAVLINQQQPFLGSSNPT